MVVCYRKFFAFVLYGAKIYINFNTLQHKVHKFSKYFNFRSTLFRQRCVYLRINAYIYILQNPIRYAQIPKATRI